MGRSHPLSGGGASGSLVEGVVVPDPTVGLGRPLDEAASDAAVVLEDVGLGALSGVVLLLLGLAQLCLALALEVKHGWW